MCTPLPVPGFTSSAVWMRGLNGEVGEDHLLEVGRKGIGAGSRGEA